MPSVTLPDGTIKYIPRVYSDTKVRSALPGPLPEFQIPVLLASSWEGTPYNVDAGLQTSEVKPGAAKFFGTAGAAADFFGRGSDMAKAFAVAQRHGLPGAYCISLSALTRASVIVDASGTNQCTIYSKTWGAPGNWTKLKFASNVLTIRRVKNYAFLSANLGSSATRIELKGDTDWIVEGMTLSIGDNDTAIGTVIVSRKTVEITSTGQKLTVLQTAAAFGSAITTAAYAAVMEYMSSADDIIISGLTTGQLFIDKIVSDSKGVLHAHKHGNFNDAVPDAVASFTPLKEISAWSTVTKGVSPAATSTQVTAFVTQMNAGGWDDFLLQHDVIPQAYFLAMGDSTSHGLMRDYAITERARGFPISVMAGVRWGDHVIGAGDDTDPKFRTAALNSQDCSIWGPGFDYEAPFLSLGPAVWGRRCKGGIGHNLTNDEIIASVWERRWDEINSGELTALLRAGFGTVKLSTGRTFRYRVAQGLSTLQSNAGLIWNVATKDTWSLMQRDMADFVDRVQLVDLEEDIVGSDEVNPSVIANTLRLRAEKSLIPRGIVIEYAITSLVLNSGANGYDVQQSYRLKTTGDYIVLDNTILIG